MNITSNTHAPLTMKVFPNLPQDLILIPDVVQHHESKRTTKYGRADTKGIRDIKTFSELDRAVYNVCLKFRDFLSDYLSANQLPNEKLYFYTGLIYAPEILNNNLFPKYLSHLRSFVSSALKPIATTEEDHSLLLDAILEFDLELALLGLSYDRVIRSLGFEI